MDEYISFPYYEPSDCSYAVARFVTGHGLLHGKWQAMRLVADGSCRCGAEEIAEHVLLYCPLYGDLRLALWRRLGFHVTLDDADTLPLLVKNESAYRAFKEFAAQALRRRQSWILDAGL